MMNYLAAAFLIPLGLFPVSGKLVSNTVDYTDTKGAALEGYVVSDDTKADKRPGILVVPDWRGITDDARERCDMLAKLGYVAFAVDVYGKGVRPTTVEEYGKLATQYKSDRTLFRDRESAAYDTLLKQPMVDPAQIAAIGYCFGGTGVIEMAKDGLALKGVVTFHGGLDTSPLSPGATFKPKVLALCGADDPFEKPSDMAAFEQQLRDNNVDYQIVEYGHAVHAFTEKSVDALNLPGAKYNADADRRSWKAMKNFFAEIFPSVKAAQSDKQAP